MFLVYNSAPLPTSSPHPLLTNLRSGASALCKTSSIFRRAGNALCTHNTHTHTPATERRGVVFARANYATVAYTPSASRWGPARGETSLVRRNLIREYMWLTAFARLRGNGVVEVLRYVCPPTDPVWDRLCWESWRVTQDASFRLQMVKPYLVLTTPGWNADWTSVILLL